jgi:hypothetical protein
VFDTSGSGSSRASSASVSAVESSVIVAPVETSCAEASVAVSSPSALSPWNAIAGRPVEGAAVAGFVPDVATGFRGATGCGA